LALREHGFGGVGASGSRGGEHVMQQVFVHAVLWTRRRGGGKAGLSRPAA
jgi:hypothetical protein